MLNFQSLNIDCLPQERAGGILRVYVGLRASYGNYWYLAQDSQSKYQYPEIIGSETTPTGGLWALPGVWLSPRLTQSETDTPSRLYTQSLTLTLRGMNAKIRDQVELLVTNPGGFFIVYSDKNGQYWALGETQGLKAVSTYTIDSETNATEIVFSAVSRHPLRTFSPSFVSSQDRGLLIDIRTLTWAELAAESYTDLRYRYRIN